MKLHILLASLLICLATTLVFARNGVVKTRDGRSIEGDITDKGPDGATISTKAGTITINRDDIVSIDYATNVKEEYRKRLAALPKDAGAKAHLDLARWLFDNKEYELARAECDKALTIDPNNADAALLRQTVERTMMLRPGGTSAGGTTTVRPGPATRPVVIAPGQRRLLDPDQINIIKQYELKDTDTKIRVRLENNVQKRFVDYDNQDSRRFAAKTDYDKAIDILQHGTAEMRKDVKIINDPQALADYKSRVQTVLTQGCATSGCHGGTNAGSLVLYAPADSDAVTYTNFYILTQYATNVDGAKRKMIDRLRPENSLILEFGLPRDKSEFDHPEAANWTHIYKDKNDPRYLQIYDWVVKGLVPSEPKYGIEYTLPTGNKPQAPPPRKEEKPAPRAENRKGANPDASPSAPGSTQDKLNEARGRIKPITPNIPTPVIPF